jgi:hypothetical protein
MKMISGDLDDGHVLARPGMEPAALVDEVDLVDVVDIVPSFTLSTVSIPSTSSTLNGASCLGMRPGFEQLPHAWA